MSNIKVFEDRKIRTQWNEQEEDWCFSVVDVIAALRIVLTQQHIGKS